MTQGIERLPLKKDNLDMHYLYIALRSAIENGDDEEITVLSQMILAKKIDEFGFMNVDIDKVNPKLIEIFLRIATNKMLLEVKPDGQTLLHLAVRKKHSTLFRWVIKASAENKNKENFVNRMDSEGCTALHYAFRYQTSDEIFGLLAIHKADPDLRDNEGRLPREYIRSPLYIKYPEVIPPGPGEILFQYQLLEKDRETIRILIQTFEDFRRVLEKKAIEQHNAQFLQLILLAIGCAMVTLRGLVSGNIDTACFIILASAATLVVLYIYNQFEPLEKLSYTEYQHLVTQARQSNIFLIAVDYRCGFYMDKTHLDTNLTILTRDQTIDSLQYLVEGIILKLSNINQYLTVTGKPFVFFNRENPTGQDPILTYSQKSKI